MPVMNKEDGSIEAGMHGAGTPKPPVTTQGIDASTNRQSRASNRFCLVRIRTQSARRSLCITRRFRPKPCIRSLLGASRSGLTWGHISRSRQRKPPDALVPRHGPFTPLIGGSVFGLLERHRKARQLVVPTGGCCVRMRVPCSHNHTGGPPGLYCDLPLNCPPIYVELRRAVRTYSP
jgi:hypothetical protein